MKIILLYGGRSAEHEVSLLSAFSVVNAVYYNYYQVQLVMITKEGRWLKGPLLTEAPTSPDTLALTNEETKGDEISTKKTRSSFLYFTDQMAKTARSKGF